MSDVDTYIAELREGASDEPVRRFTIDRDLAREKLVRYQLSEPHQYVTELIQAGVASGAARVDVELDADDVRIRFDGRGFTRQDFELLYEPGDVPDGPAASGARQQLGLGLNLALALRPKYIRVVSAGPDETAALELVPDRTDRFEEPEQALEGTTIHLRRPLGPKLVAKAAQSVLGTLPEERLIRQRCRFSPVEITLDGESVVQPDALPEPSSREKVEGQGYHGMVGFVASGDSAGAVHVVLHGVVVDTLETGLSGPLGLLAVVHVEGVQRDLSLEKILQDDAFIALLAHLRRARDRSLDKLVKALAEGREPSRTPAWMRRVVRQALLGELLGDKSPARELDLWRCFWGQAESQRVSQVWIERAGKDRALEYVTDDILRHHGRKVRKRARRCLVVTDELERQALELRFGVVLEPLRLTSAFAALSPLWRRRIVWAVVIFGVLGLLGFRLYCQSRPSARRSTASLHEPSEDDKKCAEGDAQACLRRGDLLVGTGRLTHVAPARQSYVRACQLGQKRGCREADALSVLAGARATQNGQRHWLLSRACDGWQPRACRLAAALFPRLKETERQQAQADDAAECKRSGRRLTCFRAGLRWRIGYGVESRHPTGASKLTYACREQVAVACAFVDEAPGIEQNAEPEEAWAGAYLERGCAANNLQACTLLAVLLRLGRGVAPNDARARRLEVRACTGGVALACRRACKHSPKMGCPTPNKSTAPSKGPARPRPAPPK